MDYNDMKTQKSRTLQVARFIILIMLLALLPAACNAAPNYGAPSEELPSASGFYFNTIIKITIYENGTDELLQGCLSICERLEGLLSRTLEDSDISHINNMEGDYLPSEETLELLRTAYKYAEKTNGAFDFTIEPLSKLWNFSSSSPSVPSDADIAEAASRVDFKKFVITDKKAYFEDTAYDNANSTVTPGVDLGGIAKGYAADKIREYLLSNGITNAVIDLGGNILCLGSRPYGKPFQVGIQDPSGNNNGILGVAEITDKSVVTSGVYERCFTVDGNFYHHILDTTTGYPVDNGLTSVTIFSENSVDGDALSTSCFVLGLDKGMKLIDETPNTEAIFVTSDGELHYSSDFRTPFVPSAK